MAGRQLFGQERGWYANGTNKPMLSLLKTPDMNIRELDTEAYLKLHAKSLAPVGLVLSFSGSRTPNQLIARR